MSTSGPEHDPRATGLSLDDQALTIDLADGRRLIVPLSWFPRLVRATPQQRRNWRFVGEGRGFHWPDLDEDLSVRGLLLGNAAPGARSA